MRRIGAVLALVLAVGSSAGCAEYTTTGVPAESTGGVTAAGESIAPQVDPLTGTSWALVSSALTDIDLAEHTITAEFGSGQLSGMAPVNNYTASYEAHDGELTLGPVASTKKAGEPEAMAAEGAYFALLAQVSGFERSSEELVLTADGSTLLTYHPAKDSGKDGAAMDPDAATTQAFADTLVGMSTQEAQAATEEAGYAFRVLAEDGVYNAVTSDYRIDRVNVEVEKGKVTTATAG